MQSIKLRMISSTSAAVEGAGAAASTPEQATQQKAAPMHAVESIAAIITSDLDPHLPLPRFDLHPQIVIDNAQMRHLRDLPFLRRVRAGDAPAGARVLCVGACRPTVGLRGREYPPR
jgi:hypothetical protein